jgi:hypothetical protein
MSGGSFNYLCDTWDFEDLLTKQSSLEAMAQALAGLGYAKDASRETEELLLILRQWEVQASVRIDRLRDVWKAMEWWRSHDWSEDQFKEALAEYRGQGDAVTEEPEEPKDSEQGRPEPPSEAELNAALPVYPDPRQPAYDAVYEYIRGLGDYLPPDTVHRNAIIWRAVNAALDATPVGRCVSSHCIEGGHMLLSADEWEKP